MRKAGVGDGMGVGDPVGVWARASNGILVTAKPAAPITGINFTNERRPTTPGDFFLLRFVLLIFFLILFSRSYCQLFDWNHGSSSNALSALVAILEFQNFGFPESVDRYDKQIVIFTFRNYRKGIAAQL